MTELMIGFIAIISTIIYVLIGWFVRALVQDEWEAPSMFLTMVWPIVIIILGIIQIFTWVNDLATKIKEKKNG